MNERCALPKKKNEHKKCLIVDRSASVCLRSRRFLFAAEQKNFRVACRAHVPYTYSHNWRWVSRRVYAGYSITNEHTHTYAHGRLFSIKDRDLPASSTCHTFAIHTVADLAANVRCGRVDKANMQQ